MNAFSYKRWSSKGQTSGDSFERQSETAKRVCESKGWNLVDLPPEAATSAFKGKNLSHKGILGQFIAKVDRGEIETPCVLVLEKMDRFSRGNVDEVMPLFMALLKKGVEVFSVIENVHYTQEAMRENPTLVIIQMCLAFVAANQYSKALSERIKPAKQRQISKAVSGEKIWLFSSCPHYLDWNGKEYVPNAKAEIVKRIYREYLSGMGFNTIARSLNQEGIRTFSTGKGWSQTTINKILSHRAVLGEYKGTKGFFPQIISNDDFNRVQGLIEKNKMGKGKVSGSPNILRGLAYCVECGNPVVQHAGKVHSYFRCVGQYRGICNQSHLMRRDDVEGFLFTCCLNATPSELLGKNNTTTKSRIADLNLQLSGVTKQITKLVSLEDMGIDELKNQLTTLKSQRESLMKQISALSVSIGVNSVEAVGQLKTLFQDKDWFAASDLAKEGMTALKNPEFRMKVRGVLSGIIKRILMNFNEQTFQVEFLSGEKSEWFPIN